KGSVIDDETNPRHPDPQFHIQVLRPIGDGFVHVDLSSAPFRLPVTTASSQIVSPNEPLNLCVHKGDFVDFNDIGGHEWSWPTGGPDGMHVQVVNNAAPNSQTAFYTKNNGTKVGSELPPDQTFPDTELLI